MKVALYIGTHAGDDWLTRLGWAATRLVQRGENGDVTHVESILAEHADGQVTIGSASLRDNGVRTKTAKLDPTHWRIVDVPAWDVSKAVDWYVKHQGEDYDRRGALATVLPGHHKSEEWFCNEAVGAPFLQCPQIFGPSQFASITLSFGSEITAEFFGARSSHEQPAATS